MAHRTPAAFERRTDPLRTFPPAANQEIPPHETSADENKELHVQWMEKYLRKTRKQDLASTNLKINPSS